jgi:small subunit ribosomal protein S2
MGDVALKDLLEAGVHFGHQTKRWNPRMKPFIFAEKNGIHIIDLQKTLDAVRQVQDEVRKVSSAGKNVLFLGTKPQAKHAVEEEATRCGMPYVSERWLGGTLTNFNTIRRSLGKLEYFERIETDGSIEQFNKKERLKMNKEKEKLLRALGGIRNMGDLPAMIFVIDTKKEANAVREARKLGIPIIGLIDTNADPNEVDYPVPANDDAMRAITLFCRVIADACLEGKSKFLEGQEAAAAAAEKQKAEQASEQGGKESVA